MERVAIGTADYERMYEAAVEMARSLIHETNEQGEKIRRLEAEIMELREKVEELRYNPYHDPTNGRFTSPNSGGGMLYVGKGQAGSGTYIIEQDFDDEEYGKWLNNKIQTARTGRLQALVSAGRKNAEEHSATVKTEQGSFTKNAKEHSATVKTEQGSFIKSKNKKSGADKFDNEAFKVKAITHHTENLSRLDILKSDVEKKFSLGEMSKKEYKDQMAMIQKAYQYSQKVIQELSENREMRYNMSKSIVIAVDFDGTIALTRYPKIIAPISETIKFLRKAKQNGATIILWTCRSGNELWEAVMWCEEHGVPIDYINENVPERVALYENDSRKISADIYIDDKAVGIVDMIEYEKSEELRFNPNHDPENGRFTSDESGGKGVDFSGESGIIEASATGANTLLKKGFRNKQALNNHKKHTDGYSYYLDKKEGDIKHGGKA